jgi:outer membrane biosynthesis protein TonB
MEATLMKVLGVISTTALLLMLGATIPAYAQEEHHEESAKPAQHEEQAKPAKQQEAAKPAKQEEAAKPARQQEAAKPARQEEAAKPARQQEAAKPAKQEEAAKPARQQEQAKPARQQEQAKSTKPAPAAKPARQAAPAKSERPQTQQAKQANRGGNAGGQQHAQRTAAEQQRQRAVPALRLSARSNSRIPDDRFRSNFGREHSFRIGRPTMVGGYSRFQYGGYWFGFVQPWPDGWYYTDDVYVDYIDGGYYLCNPYYPGAQVAISVVL